MLACFVIVIRSAPSIRDSQRSIRDFFPVSPFAIRGPHSRACVRACEADVGGSDRRTPCFAYLLNIMYGPLREWNQRRR